MIRKASSSFRILEMELKCMQDSSSSLSEKIYSEDRVSNLKEFLEDPKKWRSKYA